MMGDTFCDAKRMFRHACSFADCAKFCESDKNDLIVKTQWYIIPGIANSAFSCEVFIKALLTFQGMTLPQIQKYKHGLRGLWDAFENCDRQTAAQIRECVKAYYSSTDDALFDKKLDEASNAFPEWRYAYEGGNAQLNINFLRAFREILRTTCCKLLYGVTWQAFVDGGAKWDADDES